MELGKTLKESREALGVSLEVAEEETKIRKKYLEALENERFDILPGRVYVKGFLRNYARFLGLDPDAVLNSFEEQFPPGGSIAPALETESDEDGGKGPAWRPSMKKYLAAVIGLALIIYAGTSFLSGVEWRTGFEDKDINAGQNDGAGQNISPREPDETDPSKGVGDGGQVPQEPVQGVDLVLNVLEDRCWMQVVVDGDTAFTGMVEANETKTFKARDTIWVKAGNAGVVQAKLNGEDLGLLGGRGKVVTVNFPPATQG